MYQKLCTQRKVPLPPSLTINCSISLVKCRHLRAPSPFIAQCWLTWSYTIVCSKHSCFGLSHVAVMNILRGLHFLFIYQFLHYFSPLFCDFSLSFTWGKLVQMIHSQLRTHSVFHLALSLCRGLCYSHELLQNLCAFTACLPRFRVVDFTIWMFKHPNLVPLYYILVVF